jgi:D-amino peptidase
MKIAILTDIEGVAGVPTHVDHSYSTGKYYEASKKLLTAEVNAAVDGLLSAGVDEVVVIDAHGPGAIAFEDLHAQARLLHGRPITRPQMYGPIWESDAFVFVGQHARAGVRDGNQNHTMSSLKVDYYKLNGRVIGEIAFVALWAGVRDVPAIFLSGDAAACKEAEQEVPGIVTAAVKQGISANVELALSAAGARHLIQTKIREAVEAHRSRPVAPLKCEGPYCLEIRWKSTQDADMDEYEHGGLRVDSQTVQYHSKDLIEVFCNRHRPDAR